MRTLYHILAWAFAIFIIWGCVFILSKCCTIPPDGVSRPPNSGPLPIPKVTQLNYHPCQIEPRKDLSPFFELPEQDKRKILTNSLSNIIKILEHDSTMIDEVKILRIARATLLMEADKEYIDYMKPWITQKIGELEKHIKHLESKIDSLTKKEI